MNSKIALRLGAFFGFMTVLLGAFGAHTLKTKISVAALDIWNTAIQYQMFHTIALLAVAGLLMRSPSSKALKRAGIFLITGIIVFCGSLYLLALGAPKITGLFTPIGGVAWLIAWSSLIAMTFEKKSVESHD